jgi:hypothetical protein
MRHYSGTSQTKWIGRDHLLYCKQASSNNQTHGESEQAIGSARMKSVSRIKNSAKSNAPKLKVASHIRQPSCSSAPPTSTTYSEREREEWRGEHITDRRNGTTAQIAPRRQTNRARLATKTQQPQEKTEWIIKANQQASGTTSPSHPPRCYNNLARFVVVAAVAV